jgi:hexosaminidase
MHISIKYFNKAIFFICLNFITANCFAQINVVPMPAEVKMGEGVFNLNPITTSIIYSENSSLPICIQLKNSIKNLYGFGLPIIKIDLENLFITNTNNISLILFPKLVKSDSIPGSYALNVSAKSVSLISVENEGLFYGIQTILQLIEKKEIKINTKQKTTNNLIIKQLTIKDSPRFPYRGMHLDVCRHFYPIAYIKKYIDYLATYKFNTFHWHLTEDQGWRIEIKKYPNLTKVGSYRDRTLIGKYGSGKYDSTKYGGYYTQAQIKEIVQYAKERYITVIPEIEMPGHSTSALASYPFLGCTKGPYKVMDTWGVLDDVYCAGNDSTFAFLENVLDEVIELFPSKYIHIGGDECPKVRWKKCEACQKRMKDNNLKDEHALQSYFIQRMEKYLNSKGRNIIGWDEILEGGLAPNATVMSWRGEAGGIEAAKQNHDVIMTPGSHCYLDHSQSKNEDSLTIGSYLPLEKIYNYEPIPASLNTEQAKHILGAQGNVWTEYIANTSKLEYMIFPRMIALSEVLWSPKTKKDWKDFERRLPVIFEKLEKEKINYSKAYYEPTIKVLETSNHKGVRLNVKSNQVNSKFLFQNKATHDIIEFKDSINIDITKSTGCGIKMLGKDKIKFMKPNTFYSLWVSQESLFDIEFSIHVNKATGKKITLNKPPNKVYESDGAFTLVNGVQNKKGMAKSSEFLGFQGTDLEAIIDFDSTIEFNKVNLHTFEKKNSWIYYPKAASMEVLISLDGINFTNTPNGFTTIIPNENGIINFSIPSGQEENGLMHLPLKARFIKIIAKNFGLIPAGQPGEGKPAWMFVDEIEVL